MPNHVLVVDDDAVLRDTLCAILASEGSATEAARDGREALERAQERPPVTKEVSWRWQSRSSGSSVMT